MKKFMFRLVSLVMAVMLTMALTAFSVSAEDGDEQSAADESVVSVVDDGEQSDDADVQAAEDDDVQTSEDDVQTDESSAADEEVQSSEDANSEDTGNAVYTCKLTTEYSSEEETMADDGSGTYFALFSEYMNTTYDVYVLKDGETVASTQVYAIGTTSNITVTYYPDSNFVTASSAHESSIVYNAEVIGSDGSDYNIDLTAYPYEDYTYNGIAWNVPSGTYSIEVTNTEGAACGSTSVTVSGSGLYEVMIFFNSGTSTVEASVMGNSGSSDDSDSESGDYKCDLINKSTGTTSSETMEESPYDKDYYVALFDNVAAGAHTIYVGITGYAAEAEYTVAADGADLCVYYDAATSVISVLDSSSGTTQSLSTTVTEGSTSSSSSKTIGSASSGAGSSTSDTAKNDGNAVKTGISIAIIVIVSLLVVGGVGFFVFKRKTR